MFPDLNRRLRLSTRSRRAGFSLIELLIVIAIILIILAVALPKLTKARTYAQEMAAVKAITTIHTASIALRKRGARDGSQIFGRKPRHKVNSSISRCNRYDDDGAIALTLRRHMAGARCLI